MELNELYRVPPFEADVFSARFSPAGTYLALGLGDGTISIHAGRTGKQLALVPVSLAGTRSGATAAPSTMGLPITALRWRPEAAVQFKVSEATTAKDVLLAAGSDGVIRHVHANSGRVLSTIVDEGNQIFACDYRACPAQVLQHFPPSHCCAARALFNPSLPAAHSHTRWQAATRCALPLWATQRASRFTMRRPAP